MAKIRSLSLNLNGVIMFRSVFALLGQCQEKLFELIVHDMTFVKFLEDVITCISSGSETGFGCASFILIEMILYSSKK